MIDLTHPAIKFALYAVRQAAQLVQQVQSELVSPALTKADRSPVTVADFASQALISRLLMQSLPGDALVAEEDAHALRQPEAEKTLAQVTHFVKRFAPEAEPEEVLAWLDYNRVDTAGRFWALDPIDGTKGFLRGDQYVVALALVEAGQVQIGVLGIPNLVDAYRNVPDGPGSLVVASRGQGTWCTALSEPGDFIQLHVSGRSNPAEARVLRSFESGHTNTDQITEFSHALGIQAEPVRMDSQAKYAVLAAGKGELLLRLLSPAQQDYREKIWDQAAGSLVLEEAGGRITDLDGKALDFTTGRALIHNRGVLASNDKLHPAALEGLRQIHA